MRPGIDLNKEFTQFPLGKACRDEILQGFRASGPVFCFQGRQNDRVVLNTRKAKKLECLAVAAFRAPLLRACLPGLTRGVLFIPPDQQPLLEID